MNKANSVSFIEGLPAVVARLWRDSPSPAAARYVYFHILLFVMANILLYISGLFLYSIICKGKYFTSVLN